MSLPFTQKCNTLPIYHLHFQNRTIFKMLFSFQFTFRNISSFCLFVSVAQFTGVEWFGKKGSKRAQPAQNAINKA